VTDAEELAQIAEQEERLQFGSFSNDRGIDLGLMILDRARSRGLALAVDVRRHGMCLFHAATKGATPDNAAWIERKVRVVDRFGHSSLYMGTFGRAKGIDLESRFQLPPDTYAFDGGAFPILLQGTGPIGTVTVSGLPQREDHALVVWALERVLA